ncbi:hypothetical protein E4U13_004547 [Claviceps humidiphila]|uniref:Uncharacterized protein n=1 Tax=Claviceps humidiphila TaxID=1294629 RepID=A0A9P7TRM9_9HYPO|nr:hypothetical protein E4U13_004547 [Claviceps humidiphila]
MLHLCIIYDLLILPTEQPDLEDSLQNLSPSPGISTAQRGPSEGAPDTEDLRLLLEQYRKHISPA